MKKIIILGDSTSMTVGLEKEAYPFLLCQDPVWGPDTRFVNTSQPGMTAADSAAYLFRKGGSLKDVCAVIVYIGNCDANATELKKGRFTFFRQCVHELRDALGMPPLKVILSNKLLRYEWNDKYYDPLLEKEESARDFGFNLSRIVLACQRSKIPVILVRPKANALFPAGVGKGNFIFYHYANLDGRLSDRLSFPDQGFAEAYRLYESGDFEAGRQAYKKILVQLPDTFSSEYPVLVTHNYALACWKAGRVKEAEVLFAHLIKERNIRREIFLYNYAFLRRGNGDLQGYSDFLRQAYDADTSMYRIKKNYIDVIDAVSRQYQGVVHVVDMTDLPDELFVDHCHLLARGQSVLKGRLREIFFKLGLAKGQMRAEVHNDLINLELSLGNTKEFHHYYKSYGPFSSEELERQVAYLKEDLEENSVLGERSMTLISSEMARALEYYRKHPCFADARDICRMPPRFAYDVGRFPEFFLVRQMAWFFKRIEQDPDYKAFFPDSLSLLRRSSDLFSALPDEGKGQDRHLNPLTNPEEDLRWVDRILVNVRAMLIEHIQRGPQFNERLLTTIYWFFRETLRWGAHSRYSMRYDRLTLEYSAEALHLAGWINFQRNGSRESHIKALSLFLTDLVGVHERYARGYTLGQDNRSLIEEYAGALRILSQDPRLGINGDSSNKISDCQLTPQAGFIGEE